MNSLSTPQVIILCTGHTLDATAQLQRDAVILQETRQLPLFCVVICILLPKGGHAVCDAREKSRKQNQRDENCNQVVQSFPQVLWRDLHGCRCKLSHSPMQRGEVQVPLSGLLAISQHVELCCCPYPGRTILVCHTEEVPETSNHVVQHQDTYKPCTYLERRLCSRGSEHVLSAQVRLRHPVETKELQHAEASPEPKHLGTSSNTSKYHLLR